MGVGEAAFSLNPAELLLPFAVPRSLAFEAVLAPGSKAPPALRPKIEPPATLLDAFDFLLDRIDQDRIEGVSERNCECGV